MNNFDVIIIGGGPAGLTAGLYTSRSGLKSLLLEMFAPGGLMATTEMIENYPGFPQGISGSALAEEMQRQAEKFGLVIKTGQVVKIIPGEQLTIVLDSGDELKCRAAIVASGAAPREMGIPGEREFRGQGVSYCATCDGAFFRGREVAVIGGGDSAIQEAISLTHLVSRVHVIHRRDKLRAAKALQDRAVANDKISIHWNTVPAAVLGDNQGVTGLRLRNVKDQSEADLPLTGVFFYVGLTPHTEFLPPQVEKDEQGFIVTDAALATGIPGLFAAGDVRVKRLRQVSTAVGDGALAAWMAEEYLQKL